MGREREREMPSQARPGQARARQAKPSKAPGPEAIQAVKREYKKTGPKRACIVR